MSRIDEIFQVEKLRKNWKQDQKTVENTQQADSPTLLIEEGQQAVKELEILNKLVNQRFPGDKSLALNSILEEIKEQILDLFSPDMEKDDTELRMRIDERLCDIEDIIEALEVGSLGAGK